MGIPRSYLVPSHRSSYTRSHLNNGPKTTTWAAKQPALELKEGGRGRLALDTPFCQDPISLVSHIAATH